MGSLKEMPRRGDMLFKDTLKDAEKFGNWDVYCISRAYAASLTPSAMLPFEIVVDFGLEVRGEGAIMGIRGPQRT
jgi:hypothetical protein